MAARFALTCAIMAVACQSATTKRAHQDQVRVLILLADTGGGHRASARAIEQMLLQSAESARSLGTATHGVHVETIDIWNECAPAPLNALGRAYAFAASRPWLWSLAYQTTSWRPARAAASALASWATGPGFESCLSRRSPDVIVSVHPLCQAAPLRAAAAAKLHNARFVTVVTDLSTAHAAWFHPDVDACIVATEALARRAADHGVHRDRIMIGGLPVRQEFFSKVPRVNSTQRRGQAPADTANATVLVLGGGDGLGDLESAALGAWRGILRRGVLAASHVRLVVVCGRNIDVQVRLARRSWLGVDVTITGFVSDMAALMSTADVAVTKAGPGTIAEAAAVGLPLIISSELPGQERGNADFAVTHGFGIYAPSSALVADAVSTLLHPGGSETLAAMRKAARACWEKTLSGFTAQDILGPDLGAAVVGPLIH